MAFTHDYLDIGDSAISSQSPWVESNKQNKAKQWINDLQSDISNSQVYPYWTEHKLWL